MPVIQLRRVVESDLNILFEQQLDPDANHMAAFVPTDPSDREAFTAHWARVMADESVEPRTILADGRIAGNLAKFIRLDRSEVCYWIGKEFWGQGIATRALELFLEEIDIRPIYASAAADNIASIRVLEKCGFTLEGHDRGFSNARGEEIEEVSMELV